MKKTFACALIAVLAACGGGPKRPTTTNQGEVGDAEVDPTVPSWTPQACKDYNKAVFQAIKCEAVEQAKRDEIKATYDAAAAGWKAEENADEAKVNEVAASCVQSTESVRATIGSLCVPPAKN